MKKYQQLLLAILSIFSFGCLLIYRHEYNKLRYVLEVLNFFGSPGASTVRPPECIQNITYNGYSVPEFPLTAWQRISNSLYIYSAYWETATYSGHVKAIAIGVLNENLSYGCYLWYDSNPKKRSGQFSFSEIAYKPVDSGNIKSLGKSKTKAFVFYCETEGKGSIPFGVSFYKTNINETSQGYVPVIHHTNSHVKNSIAICIMPTVFPTFNKSDYLEFLSFHKILGIKDFFIYGVNYQHNLLSQIQRMFPDEVKLNILLWNYPFYNDTNLMRVVAENDCKTRAAGVFKNAVILDWNKYIVPINLLNISKILNELDVDSKIYKFQLPTLLFCLEYNDDVNSNINLPIILRKTRYSLPKLDIPVSVFRPFVRTGQVKKISKNIISVHQYTSCKDYKIKSKNKKSDSVDSSMLMFKDKLLHSKLLNFKFNTLK